MYDLGQRRIYYLPTRLLYPVRKIDVFAIHEIILIKIAYPIQHALPEHHQGSGKYIYLGLGIGVKIRDIILSE